MANIDSINISRTIGMDNKRMALPKRTEVKSCSVPEMDSRISLHNDLSLLYDMDLEYDNIFFLYDMIKNEIDKTIKIKCK